MFNKLKQFKDLRSQAKTMQSALAEEEITVEKSGISLTINGNFKITKFTIEENLSKEKQEKIIKDIFNEAVKKVQKVMARKMQEMGGLSGLGGLG